MLDSPLGAGGLRGLDLASSACAAADWPILRVRLETATFDRETRSVSKTDFVPPAFVDPCAAVSPPRGETVEAGSRDK